MARTKIGTTDLIASGEMTTVTVDGKAIAIANVDGEFFAIDDLCSHAECSFGEEGFLDGQTVTCGCHGAQFDVTSGKVQSLPATQDVTSYTVETEGQDLYIVS